MPAGADKKELTIKLSNFIEIISHYCNLPGTKLLVEVLLDEILPLAAILLQYVDFIHNYTTYVCALM